MDILKIFDQYALSLVILIGIGWFWIHTLWPWLTKQWELTTTRRETERTEMFKELALARRDFANMLLQQNSEHLTAQAKKDELFANESALHRAEYVKALEAQRAAHVAAMEAQRAECAREMLAIHDKFFAALRGLKGKPTQHSARKKQKPRAGRG